MGKMYTLQPDESINDHVKESMSIINHIVELSIGCMRDLANPHEGTFVDMVYNEFMRSLEHIRESIQMLDELCDELEDELEDDKDEVRREYEEKVLEFFNRFVNSDEYNNRVCDLIKRCQELSKWCQELSKWCQELDEDRNHFSNLAISRNKELEEERERSNQLEEKNRKLTTKFELAKKFLHQRRAEVSRLKEELRQTQLVKDAQKKVIDEKENALLRLNHEIWELQEQAEYWEDLAKKYADPDGHSLNNPCNFCGNCGHYAQMGKDDGDFEGICTQHYIKRVDPDDASCSHFKPTYDTRVVIGKPEFPCCDHCNHDDCDNCTLCPF